MLDVPEQNYSCKAKKNINDMYDVIMIRYYLQPDKVELDSFKWNLKKHCILYYLCKLIQSQNDEYSLVTNLWLIFYNFF